MIKVIFKNNIWKYIFLTIIFSLLFLSNRKDVEAAILFTNTGSAKVSAGSTFSVKILVNTENQAINNADVVMNFPADLLEVISVSKSSSIFTLWVEEPKFSNTSGTVTLNGGVPNPGYTGINGEIITVSFKAKAVGNAPITFGTSAVRLNDGLGTDVLKSKLPLSIEVTEVVPIVTPVIIKTNSTPQLPSILSSTHINQDEWYSGSTATFTWNPPADVTSIQTILSENKNAVPTITYDGTVSQKTVNNLTEGIQYFHLRYLNSMGWGPIAHYRIQVDQTSPEKFDLSVVTNETRNIVILNSKDSLSGLDYYGIQIDEGREMKVGGENLNNFEYTLPVQNPGEHKLKVVAYDRARNNTVASASFTSPVISVPTIYISPEISRNDILEVEGKTKYPDNDVEIFIKTSDGKVTSLKATTNSDGSYRVNSPKISVTGTTEVWAQLVFSDSVKSDLSDKKIVEVRDGPVTRFSRDAIYTLSFVMPAIIIFLGIIFVLYLGWHKFFGLKRKLNMELKDVAGDIHKSLMTYKDELGSQLNKLEKLKEDRDLNKKEEKIFKELQMGINKIDEFIEKKIRQIK